MRFLNNKLTLIYTEAVGRASAHIILPFGSPTDREALGGFTRILRIKIYNNQ